MEMIGKYQILKKIGSGGMATVYLVQDDLTGMKIAMKLLHDHYAEDDHIRKRFLQEARLQLNLNHPNIVRCYNVERVDNRYFILLEYIPGPPLNQVIKQRENGLRIEEIIPIFTQILAGMEYAHQKGVIHRDIKPMNILLSEYSGYFRGHEIAKISDFGIAKALDQEGHTRTGAQLGSPYFMSPEQIQNAAGVDHRTDIYSLGVLLYQLTTGKLPYHPTNNPVKLMEEIVKDPIIDPKTFNKNMPNWLVDIIYKATAKNPEDRFQTCSQFSNLIYKYASSTKMPNIHPIYKRQTPSGISNSRPKFGKKQRRESKPEVKKSNKQFTISLVLGLVIVFLLLLSMAFWQLRGSSSFSEYAGQPVKKVRQELLNNGYKVITEYAYKENIPAGQVFNLEFSDKAKSEVRLWVSKGTRYLYLPNFVGMDVDTVIHFLKRNGLKVRLIKRESNVNKTGIILSTFPLKNTLCKNGDEIQLIINYNSETPLKDEYKFFKNTINFIKRNKIIINKTILENNFNSNDLGHENYMISKNNSLKIKIVNGKLMLIKKRTINPLVYYFPLEIPEPLNGIITRIDITNSVNVIDQSTLMLVIKFENDFIMNFNYNIKNCIVNLYIFKKRDLVVSKQIKRKLNIIKNKNVFIIEIIFYKNNFIYFINGTKIFEMGLPFNENIRKIGIAFPKSQLQILIDNLLIDELI